MTYEQAHTAYLDACEECKKAMRHFYRIGQPWNMAACPDAANLTTYQDAKANLDAAYQLRESTYQTVKAIVGKQ